MNCYESKWATSPKSPSTLPDMPIQSVVMIIKWCYEVLHNPWSNEISVISCFFFLLVHVFWIKIQLSNHHESIMLSCVLYFMKGKKSRLPFTSMLTQKESYDSLAIQTDFWTKAVGEITLRVVKIIMGFFLLYIWCWVPFWAFTGL